jgi:hypothetical protein
LEHELKTKMELRSEKEKAGQAAEIYTGGE